MIHTSNMPNGITICSDNFTFVETVSIVILVKSGGVLENEQNYGISHFLEHMAFKGTKNYSAKELAQQFDNIGGCFNAYTSKEKTVYYAKVLKENVDKAMNLLADILQHSVFKVEELEKERNVIQQELAQAEDTPDDIIFDYFQDTAFASQPMGASLLGSREFIQSVTRDDIVEFMQNNYTSENIYIASAGNLKHEELLALSNKYFGSYAYQGAKNVLPQSSYTAGFFAKQQELEQMHVVLGFEGVSYFSELFYIQYVAALICGGGMSSRLFQEVREKRGLAYSISAFSSNYHDVGIFSIYSATEVKFVEELVKVTIAELQKLSNGITSAELVSAKAQLKSSLIMSMESTVSRAGKLVSNTALLGRYITVEEIQQKIESITVDDIREFFTKFILKSSPTFASIGKDGTDKVQNIIKTNLG